MRKTIIDGRTVLVLSTVRYEDDGTDTFPVYIFRSGRGVVVTTDNPKADGFDLVDENIVAGPKTLARVIEDAVVYGHSKGSAKQIRSYWNQGRSGGLSMQKAGRSHLTFVPPCGYTYRMTVNEATKLVAALRTL